MEKPIQAEPAVTLCQRLSSGYLFLLLTVFLLFCVPYTNILSAKYVAFLILCGGFSGGMALLTAELLLLHSLSWRWLRERLRRCWIPLAAVGAYLLLTVLSAFCSPYDYALWKGMTRYEGLLTQLLYCFPLMWLAIYGVLKRAHIYAFGGTMLVFCGLCWLQFLGYNPLSLYPKGYSYYDAYTKYGGEYLGTIGNADLVSALLAVASLVFLASLLAWDGRRRFWLLLPLIVCLGTLLRAGVAAGVLSVGISSLILLPLGLHIKGYSRWKLVLLVELSLVLVGLAFLWLFPFDSGTLAEIHQVLNGHIDESFGSSRIKIWRAVAEQIPRHPMLSTGPDTMAAWDLPSFSRYLPDVDMTIQANIDVAHNEYLNIAAQQGIPALVSYLSLLLYAFVLFVKANDRRALLISFAAVIAYLIQAFFCFSQCSVTPAFFAFLGLLISNNNEGEVMYDA